MPVSPLLLFVKLKWHIQVIKNSPWAEPKYKHSRKLSPSSVLLGERSLHKCLSFAVSPPSRVQRGGKAWMGKGAHFPRSWQKRKSGHKQKSFGNLISLWARLLFSAKWVSPTSASPTFSVQLRRRTCTYRFPRARAPMVSGQKCWRQGHVGLRRAKDSFMVTPSERQSRADIPHVLHAVSSRRPRGGS